MDTRITRGNQVKSNRSRGSKAILAIGILMIFVFVSCSADADPGENNVQLGASLLEEDDQQGIAVETAPVSRGRLRSSIEGSGIIQGIQEVIIRPFTNGVIESVQFELGQEISSDDALVTLDDRVARLTWLQLSGEYQSALADLESQKNLYELGSLSLNQLNQIQARVDGLAAQVEQARDSLAYTSITSPIDGRIAEKADNLIPGDLVASGQQIARVVDLSRLRIELSLGQDQIFLVEENLPAAIRITSPRGTIEALGIVSAVAAGSDQRTGSWRVIVDFDNPDPQAIKAGMSARVSIESDLEPMRDLVPLSSLILNEDRADLFIADGEIARRIPVQVLDNYGELAAVLPLDPEVQLSGRRVLTSGLSRIQDGDKIALGDTEIARN
jgi:membrane fusion protein (multidrug efflux system)